MTKKFTILIKLFFCFFLLSKVSAQTITIYNMTVDGTYKSNIIIPKNGSSVKVYHMIKIEKPANQVLSGYLRVYTKDNNNNIKQVHYVGNVLANQFTNNNTLYTAPAEYSLDKSMISEGKLYAQLEDSQINYKSSEITISLETSTTPPTTPTISTITGLYISPSNIEDICGKQVVTFRTSFNEINSYSNHWAGFNYGPEWMHNGVVGPKSVNPDGFHNEGFYYVTLQRVSGKKLTNITSEIYVSGGGLAGKPSTHFDVPLPNSINGIQELCGSASYNLSSSLPSCHSVEWSVLPNNIVALTVNGNTATLQRIGSANGFVNIVATIKEGTTIVNVLTKYIEIGAPVPSTIFGFENNNQEFSSGGYYNFGLNVPDGYQVEWQAGGCTILRGQGTPTLSVEMDFVPIRGGSPKGMYINARYKKNDACGWSDYVYRSGTVVGGEIEMLNELKIANNPADQSFTVLFTDESPSENSEILVKKAVKISNKSYDFKLYNKSMQLVKTAKSKGENVTINTFDLPNDIYHLVISDGKKTTSRQIMVKH